MIKRMFALAAVALLAACGGDPEFGNIDIPTTLDAQSVEGIVGEEVTFSNASIFENGFTGEAKLTFTSSSTFELDVDGNTEDGTVTFGSCTFTFSRSGLNPVTFDPCLFRVSGTSGNEQLEVVLGNNTSQETGISVDVEDNGDGTCTISTNGFVLSDNVPCGDTGVSGV